VAAALLGGVTAAVQVPGGRVLTGRLRLPRSMRVVAVVPGAQLSTAAARKVLPASYSRADAVHNLARVAVLAARLARGETGDLWELLDDRFHQPYRAPLVPGLTELLDEARAAGASGGFLSGAGPTVLVLAGEGSEDAVAERLARVARRFDAEPRIMRLGIEAGGARYTRPRG
jgi:homoserine kinase